MLTVFDRTGIETGPPGSEGEWREPSRSIFDAPGHLRAAWQAVCPTEAFQCGPPRDCSASSFNASASESADIGALV